MKPLRLDLEMWTDSAFEESLEVTVDGVAQDFTGWEFKSIAAASTTATEALFELAVAVKRPGILSLHVGIDVLAALFPAGDTANKKTVQWVLKAKPAVPYAVRLFYGQITISRGLLPWL